MKKAIIGAGGFAREVKAHIGDSTIIYFVDDEYWGGEDKFILPLSQFDPNEYEVLVAIGDPKDRLQVVKKLPVSTRYFTFIHPSAQVLGNDVEIGEGSVICAGVIITTNCKIGKHAHLNLHTTIGHDCRIGDYFTTAPGVKVSGNCNIKDRVYIGTNSSIREKLSISDDTLIGLKSGVVANITEAGVYVGTPAKRIR
jgi:sugar O-acyltransferase (sialic acid O-acetyltransferase NeuD family)